MKFKFINNTIELTDYNCDKCGKSLIEIEIEDNRIILKQTEKDQCECNQSFCPHCKTLKHINCFYNDKSRSSGKTSYCSECHKLMSKASKAKKNIKKQESESSEQLNLNDKFDWNQGSCINCNTNLKADSINPKCHHCNSIMCNKCVKICQECENIFCHYDYNTYFCKECETIENKQCYRENRIDSWK